jgi:DNA mismatch repair protein MutS
VHLDATEHNDHIVFLHSIKEGPASKSYGLQVAKLAGMPDAVVQAAKHKLASLEAPEGQQPHNGMHSPAAIAPQQPDMFTSTTHPAVTALADTDPDDLSPKQALEVLYQLKKLT